jgi:hypothetical protein
MRLKQGAIGNTLRGTHCKHREQNGNSMGNHWELDWEHVGNKGKMKKNQGCLSGC